MHPVVRRLVYVASYELIAIALTTGGLVIFGFTGTGSTLIAVLSSAVALIWNYLWNACFDRWIRRQASQTRTLKRRIIHAIGFEGGMVVLFVPTVAAILQISFTQALVIEASMLVFFLFYTFVFAWTFDLVFPLHRRPPKNSGEEGA